MNETNNKENKILYGIIGLVVVIALGLLILNLFNLQKNSTSTSPTGDNNISNPTSPDENDTIQNESQVELYIGSITVPCIGVGPQRCMLVKENIDEEYKLFYDQIQGFDRQDGTEYQILVDISQDLNPPQDTSEFVFTLNQILQQQEVPYINILTPLDFTTISTESTLDVSGTARGLFENNVVLQISYTPISEAQTTGLQDNIVYLEPTTSNASDPSQIGNWEQQAKIQVPANSIVVLEAFSTDAKTGERDPIYNTVLFSE